MTKSQLKSKCCGQAVHYVLATGEYECWSCLRTCTVSEAIEKSDAKQITDRLYSQMKDNAELSSKIPFEPTAKEGWVEGTGDNVVLADEGTPLAVFQKERTDAISEMFDRDARCGTLHTTSKLFVKLDKCVETLLSTQRAEARRDGQESVKVTENTSDGFHTFKELYEFRKVYNAVLFNEWAAQGKYDIHKSKKYSDGKECFGGGWFIVVAQLPSGQISNHYEMKEWDLFECQEREIGAAWDGHTPQDVLNRLSLLAKKKEHD